MRDPSDDRFLKIQELHRTGRMVGLDRPVTRATWSRESLQPIKSVKPGVETVRYFNKDVTEYEFSGLKSVSIERSIGQDAATCTIEMWNYHGTTSQPEGVDTAGRKGWLSPGHGNPIPAMKSVFDGADAEMGMDDSQFVTYPTQWGYVPNMYRDVFVPNRVIRVYQGYGSDNFDVSGQEIYVHDSTSPAYVNPKDDTKLYMTGVWLIDQVTINADGTLTIECRDLAKLLIEQYIYPPLLPMSRFPLAYCPAHKAQGKPESVGKNVASYHSSSVDARYGHNAAQSGHKGSDAFDGKAGTFWLSGPQTARNGVEWIQASCSGPVNEVVLSCHGGNYIVYISVYEDGGWQGTSTVTITSGGSNTENLTQAGWRYVIATGDTLWDLAGTYYGDNSLWPIIAKANNNIIADPHWIYPGQRIKIPYVNGTSNPFPSGYTGTAGTRVPIPYVERATVPGTGNVGILLPRTYDAQYVRVVFTSLGSVSGTSGYRAGLREIVARNHVKSTYIPTSANKPGYITDWTAVIKELAAWAGFTWVGDGDLGPSEVDPVIGKDALGRNMRIWGDFEILGAGPVVCTPGDYFMSKSFMDGCRQIVDFIGGIFYIDESGGVQFRLPNIWSGGNFLNDSTGPASLAARTPEHPIELHEDVNLVSYSAVISDASLRSEILVVGGQPNVHMTGPVAGGYVLGYNPVTTHTSAIDFTDLLGGQYRFMIVPGDTSKLFYTEKECQRMAELIALFILFTYRQGTASIPAHPGLQLDDQVRIFDRVSYETNIHYVSGISSKHDLASGSFTMDLTTHWLGKDPNTDWFVNKAQLTPAVKSLPAILARIGMQPGGDGFEQTSFGT